MILISKTVLYQNNEKRIRNRSSTIPITYLRKEIIIYNGKKWHRRFVNRWMVGFKFGEFTWNRKYAQFKSKRKKKGKK